MLARFQVALPTQLAGCFPALPTSRCFLFCTHEYVAAVRLLPTSTTELQQADTEGVLLGR